MSVARQIRHERALALAFAGRELLLDCAGAVLDVASQSLILADLHLEKAESFARSGQFLPPYDSLATLRRLEALAALYAPARIILLGDSFHRANSVLPFDGEERRILAALAAQAELHWITGNHDPDVPEGVPGLRSENLGLGPVLLHHLPVAQRDGPEMFGHFHPAARLITRAGARRRRCFVASARRLLLPAFGTLTGGMDVREPAIAELFPESDARAHLLGEAGVHTVPLSALMR